MSVALSVHAKSGNKAEIKRILGERLADPNCRDSNGHTPLMIACVHNKHHCVEALLEFKEVDHTVADNDDLTPLIVAAYHGHEKSVYRFLLSDRELKDLEDAKVQAKRKGHGGLSEIIGAFQRDAEKTRRQLRVWARMERDF